MIKIQYILHGLLMKKISEIGLTIIELLIGIALIGVLAGIAVPGYLGYKNKTRINVAISDIMRLQAEIDRFVSINRELPDALSDLGDVEITDPWGKDYEYLRIDGGTTPGLNGKRRRDKNANPVNSDYDLYSRGKDGLTAAQFMAQKARDDVVRANDGEYFGLAEEH